MINRQNRKYTLEKMKAQSLHQHKSQLKTISPIRFCEAVKLLRGTDQVIA